MFKFNDKFHLIYKIGLFLILALPLLNLPPLFAPPDWGKTIIFRSIMAILLFVFCWQFFYRKKNLQLPELKKNKIFWILAVFFGIYFLASIFSVDPNFSFWGSPYRGGGFATFIFYFAFLLLAFFIVKKEDWQKLWDFSIVVGILVSVIAIIQYFNHFDRPPSTMGNTLMLATYLLLLIFMSIGFFFNKENSVPKKIFYSASSILFLCVILLTGSRAAYLGLTIGIIYFLFLFAKNNLTIKISAAVFLVILILFVFYINYAGHFPKFLEQNRLFNSIKDRLSIKLLLQDPRFFAWSNVDLKIIAQRPLLGYGPENFSVGFDKNYDPSVPQLSVEGQKWWDRAHNILVQTASDAGIFAVITYVILFVFLFWLLNKAKQKSENKALLQAIQAALITYFIDNFFSIDSFSIYLIFFLLVAYVMHLLEDGERKNINFEQKNSWYKQLAIAVLFLGLIIFLWQYNFLPLQINAQINTANDLSKIKKCDQAFLIMDKNLQSHSFLDSYNRLEYAEFSISCSNYYPQNNLSYIKKDLEVISQASKIQPLYTRYWLSLASYNDDLAAVQKDQTQQNLYLQNAQNYLEKARNLSPKRQEITLEEAKIKMIKGDYSGMQEKANECITLYKGLPDCYFYRAIAEIYQKKSDLAQSDLNKSNGKSLDENTALNLLANAYITIPDYKNLANVFEELIKLNPNIAQYHSSLAFFYKELGKYESARKEALIVLQLSPESKPNVDAFLKSLP